MHLSAKTGTDQVQFGQISHDIQITFIVSQLCVILSTMELIGSPFYNGKQSESKYHFH